MVTTPVTTPGYQPEERPSTEAYLTRFLRRLDAVIQSPPGCHAAVILFRYGSGEEGWEERLGVQVMALDGPHALFFDPGDLDRPPEELADTCAAAAGFACRS